VADVTLIRWSASTAFSRWSGQGIQNIPSQMPVPWIQAMGTSIAPAIRKPHAAVCKQTTMCVIHAANTHMTKPIAARSDIRNPDRQMGLALLSW